MSLTDNIIKLKQRIEIACKKAGRSPDEITLVAVTKTVGIDEIQRAIDSGIQHIGENRVQEAEQKFEQIGKQATWHLIGHLQTNKVKKAIPIFDFIHSVDSLHLAEAISKHAIQMQQEIPCLVEVKTSAEATKFGIAPESTIEFVRQIAPLPGIQVQGLMTIGAFLPDPEQVRPYFRMLRKLRDEVEQAGIGRVTMQYLSMGMTNDFEVAIEEGANMIRVGRAIFGERN
ncbi:YggS family pyridoxal phosphate-dependent enzyme [candidate division KSB1 bacterium]|nr:YggS family pyridoxal phosphate-dependent enzyme [candidate division KSB1 bacterium]